MKIDKLTLSALLLCGTLLALNFHFSAKNKAAIAEQEKEQRELLAQKESLLAEASQIGSDTPQEGTEETGNALDREAAVPAFQGEEIILSSSEARFKFNTATGGISRVEIPEQHEVNQLTVPIELNRFGKNDIGSLQSEDHAILDLGYKVIAQSDRSLTFLGKLKNGLLVQKAWTFLDGEVPGAPYRLQYKLTIENPQDRDVDASSLHLFAGGAAPLYKGELPDQSGFFYMSEKGYKKVKISKFKKGAFSAGKSSISKDLETLKFAGVGNQFFTTFFTPSAAYAASFEARSTSVTLPLEAGGGENKEVSLDFSLPRETIAARGGREVYEYELYAGPKHYQTLKKIEPNDGLVLNYGFFKPISGVLNNVLTFLHNAFFVNFAGGYAWGLSIISLTVVIRTFMWPLHNISARSMKRMSKLQPKIKELKEKYPDDPQKVQQEQMKLFGQYGINPVGGCLPMLGQIPIFFGLFTMLKSAVEFRHEKFLWIDDLSQPDTIFTIPFSLPFFENGIPINILPLLMLVTMIIQMSMNPPVSDPTQKMLMRFMPIMMVVFCYNFASALALYWTTSNLFTIFQTWLMKKMPEPELKERQGAKKGGFMEKLQKQAEEMQRLKEMKDSGKSPQAMRDAKPKKKRGPRTGG